MSETDANCVIESESYHVETFLCTSTFKIFKKIQIKNRDFINFVLSFSTKKIYRAAASAKQPPTVTVVSAEVKCNRHMTSPIGGSGRCMEMLLRFTSASNTCFYYHRPPYLKLE